MVKRRTRIVYERKKNAMYDKDGRFEGIHDGFVPVEKETFWSRVLNGLVEEGGTQDVGTSTTAPAVPEASGISETRTSLVRRLGGFMLDVAQNLVERTGPPEVLPPYHRRELLDSAGEALCCHAKTESGDYLH